MSILLVGGRFDDRGGAPSGYVRKLAEALNIEHSDIHVFNGGNWAALAEMQKPFDPREYDCVLWFADIPNDKPKFVEDIKVRAPYTILVTSKNNIDERYSFKLLLARALKSKSNLMVEFKKRGEKFVATLLDPLGNVFLNEEPDIQRLAWALSDRLDKLMAFTRIPSRCVGDTLDSPVCFHPDFLRLVREYAERFHELIHVGNDRFMGNISFRCEHGFPSFRDDDLIYISRRNIDKRDVNIEGFVACQAAGIYGVRYYGGDKPSVDAPVQLRLYARYPKIRYMLHSHTYLEGAPMTHGCVPCGAMEEVQEIALVVPDVDVDHFRVNLRGHGSLVAGSQITDFIDLPYVARPMPELQELRTLPCSSGRKDA